MPIFFEFLLYTWSTERCRVSLLASNPGKDVSVYWFVCQTQSESRVTVLPDFMVSAYIGLFVRLNQNRALPYYLTSWCQRILVCLSDSIRIARNDMYILPDFMVSAYIGLFVRLNQNRALPYYLTSWCQRILVCLSDSIRIARYRIT